MSDDLLGQAIKALRETGEPTPDELARLRARLDAPARPASVTRFSFVRWTLPLAAVFLAATALAATPSVREAVVEAVQAIVQRVTGEQPPAPRRAAPRPRVEAPIAPLPAPQVSVPEGASDAGVPAPRVEPPRRPRAVRAPAESAPVPEPAPYDADLETYRKAHALHFTEHRYDMALRAWEQYWTRFPGGRFAVEAQYNRAICLVRLGRKDEARRALAPFAAGEVGGGYRRDEARRLLEALDAQP